MFNRVVCIELEASKVRICEADCSKRQIHVYRCISFDTPKNAIEDGYIRDRDAIAGALKEKLKEAGIKVNRLIFTIASTKIACREAVIPFVRDNRIQDVVNANFTEYFPVDISEFISTYSVVGKVNDGRDRSLRLFVLAAPENMVKDYYDIAGRLGGETAAIDYAGNSSSQAYSLNSGNEASLIVRVGSRITFLNVMENGMLSLPRSLSYGSEALASDYKGDDSRLADLVNDITRIIEYYTRKENKRISSVYINGQVLNMPGFQALIKQQLGIEAKSLAIRDNIRFHSGLSLSEAEKEEYLCCIGAAVSPVNFVPHKFLEKYRKSGSIHNFLLALSASVAVGAILIISSYLSYRSEKMKNDALKDEIIRLSEINLIYDEHAAQKERYRRTSEVYALTESPNDELVNLLDELEKRLPAEATVETLSVNSSGITLSLRTSSELTAAATIRQLKAIPLLSQINAGAITLLEDENKVKTVKFVVTGVYGIGEQYYENEKNVGP
jgi:type IV pilus assembly protein PilN